MKSKLGFVGGAPHGDCGATTQSSAMLVETLLDSSLIITTKDDLKYNAKLIVCGNYIQLYEFENTKYIKSDNKTDLNLKKINISFDNSNNFSNKEELKHVEARNINRSKLECQRLAKSNADEWKTFITLTYKENLTDIDIAKKDFRYFIDKVQRVYKNLKYICIPEFQKRGAVHFHMLTNIDINNNILIYSQDNNSKFKHIKFWHKGFTKVDNLSNDIKKIVGYVSKYMTKDIDNRLYNRHRYYYSRNLIKQKEEYLNLNNPRHIKYLKKILQNKNLIYNNEYQNFYNSEKVAFKEFL